MDQPEIPRIKWVIEFFILLAISFTVGCAAFFFPVQGNLVLSYILLSLSLTMDLIGTYFRTYKVIFFLEAIIEEKQIERKLLKGVSKKIGTRFLLYGIVFMVFLIFDESYRQYWYIVIIVGGVLFTLMNYPDYRLKYNKELLEGKLDEKEQNYVASEDYKWYQYLFAGIPLITIYLLF